MAESIFFEVDGTDVGDGSRLTVTSAEGVPRSYSILGREYCDYSDFLAAVAQDFGTRLPHLHEPPSPLPPAPTCWKPLLTRNIHPQILCGYGDPAVLRTGEGYWLVATSNDAPDAFPILFSTDLNEWRHRGFVFPNGQLPAWAAKGPGIADFWAPEMVEAGGEYWLCFTARGLNGTLAIGLARGPRPEGPWSDLGRPLLEGSPPPGALIPNAQSVTGLIDAHIFADQDGRRYLFWKEDRNGQWPAPFARLLGKTPELIGRLFDGEADRRTAAFAAAVVQWAETRRPMERFFLLSTFVDAVVASWDRVRSVLEEENIGPDILAAMDTPIRGQMLSGDGDSLIGEQKIVLVNDQPWEGHLIEGPFVYGHNRHYWMFYAGNDFGTSSYGIGVAVADHPLGPYVKQCGPLLKSTEQWRAPGHASVAPGLDGEPQLFFHAFHPGDGGYGAFRALLTAPLQFDGPNVRLGG